MSFSAEQRYTVADYLAMERASETKHEFFEGQIFATAGASLAHNRICFNLSACLGSQLSASGCSGVGSDMRVKVQATGLYTYPDAAVFCGKAELEDESFDTLLNPVVIFEVLSPSTERYDRGAKSIHYRTIDSLRDIVLISQDSVHVERFTRGEDGQWIFTESGDPGFNLDLPSIGCTIPVRELYARVEFQEQAPLREEIPERERR